MDEDNFNIQVRKFLKKVGISSQREIEKFLYQNLENKKIALGNEINLIMTLKINVDQSDHIYEIKDKILIN
tara:strand:- start:2082 stop:2294 length:213 start_codon:yes stop_codon:yes gene_type:complete